MDPCKDFFSCLNRRFSVHKYTLCAHSSVKSVTPCDWYGLQQVEQGNRSRSVEQNNWSRGSGIYATQISKVLDWINLGLFHRIECARCPPRHLSPHLVQLEGIQVLSETILLGMIHGERGKYTWKACSWHQNTCIQCWLDLSCVLTEEVKSQDQNIWLKRQIKK